MASWFLPLFYPSYRIYVIPQADDFAYEGTSVAQILNAVETSRNIQAAITTAKLTTRLPVNQGGGCDPWQLAYYKNYTQQNCIWECRLKGDLQYTDQKTELNGTDQNGTKYISQYTAFRSVSGVYKTLGNPKIPDIGGS